MAPAFDASPEPRDPEGLLPKDVGRPRVGVVLAAGRAERLRRVTKGRSKALLRLGGISLVERAVRTLLDLGLERVVVVVGYEAPEVADVAGAVDPARVAVVRAPDWELGNGASLAAAEDAVAGERSFVLMCGDHVFGPGALRALLDGGGPSVLVDPDPDPEAWGEGTKVRVDGGRAVAFGKQLEDAAIDCGVFLLGPEIFASLRASAAEGDHSLAGAVTAMAEARPPLAEPLPPGTWWQDVDTPADLRLARKRLRRSLGKPSDGPVSRYLNRPISTRISMALSPLRIPPAAFSFLTFLAGFFAATLLAAGHGLSGGLLVQASSILDGTDGETARLMHRTSARGALLDSLLDRMVDAAIVAGLGLWAIEADFRPRIMVLLLGIAIAWAVMALAAKERGVTLTLSPTAEALIGFLMGGRDGRLLLVAIVAAFGHPFLAVLTFSVAWLFTVGTRFVVVTVVARVQPAEPE